jgi:CRISPR-associated protein Csd1
MILQALAAYYDRLSAEGAVQAPGFQEKEILWVIELETNGKFRALHRTGGEDRRGRKFVVPTEVKKSVNIAANLLWGNPEYVLGLPRPSLDEKQKAKVPKRHAAFLARLYSLTKPARIDPGVSAVLAFLNQGNFSSLQSAECWPEFAQRGGNVSFRLEGDNCLVCERSAVRDAVAKESQESPSDGQEAWCLVTGRRGLPMRLHPNIRGVRGARTSGAALVSFNRDAFSSHGWTQGANAPVSAAGTHAYATALNHLLDRSNERHRLTEGDATFVFWAAAKTPIEDQFAHLLDSYGAGEQESDGTPVRETFESARKGLRPSLNDKTPFYVLGLAPNAARLVVRFWHEGTVAALARNILLHFDDLEIVGLSDRSNLPSLWRLIGVAAREGDARRLQDNLRGQLVGGLMSAIIDGATYPTTLLARTIARCRAEKSVWPVRAALIKASLKRRFSAKEVSVSLDPGEPDVGYRLGRLFAVLEGIQRTQGDTNVTIRDRFFGAMMSAPRSVFPQLMQLKNAHLKKLHRAQDKRGLAIFFERQIDEILDALLPGAGLPAALSLEEQGRFILGYHHQRNFSGGSKEVDAALGETSEFKPTE